MKVGQEKSSRLCLTPSALASSFLNGFPRWLWQSWSFWSPLFEFANHFMFVCSRMCLKLRPVAVTPKSQKRSFLKRKTHVASSSCSVVPGLGWFFDLIGSSARYRCVLSVDMGFWWCCVYPLFTIPLAPPLKFCSIGPTNFCKNGPFATLSKSVGAIFQWNLERIGEPGWAWWSYFNHRVFSVWVPFHTKTWGQ